MNWKGYRINYNGFIGMLCSRLGKTIFEREVKTEDLATPEQIVEFKRLIEVLSVPEEIVQKYIINARSTTVDQMNREIMQKTIDHLLNKVKGENK